ncbi:sigma factor-like helix-turn-helix DNA-binding protein [Pseudomonas cichorii]|nr:sigma factor-like helix-turn-helix DNA-binding protein [Pseudomonas cichorii]
MPQRLTLRSCGTSLLQAFAINRPIRARVGARLAGCTPRAEDVVQDASPDSSTDSSPVNLATREHLSEALAQLPSQTRYAFEMYRLHGVSQKEIACNLGVSPSVVNFMIRDALVHCRKVSRHTL